MPRKGAREDEPVALRRSSRSTRGSVKPIVPMPEKSDSGEDEDDEAQKLEKSSSKVIKKTLAKKVDNISKTKKGKEKDIKTEIKNDPEITDEIHELTEKELREINSTFDLHAPDDGEELLSNDDLKTAMRSLGFEPRADEIKALMRRFSNKESKINRDSFQKIMAIKFGSIPGRNNDEITRVFNLLDTGKSGFITLENLRSIARELNENLTDEELQEMIAEADMDGNSKIDIQEFHNIMKKTNLY